MALIYDATFNTSTRLLTFLDRSGNTIYSFTVPARGIVDDLSKPLYLLSKQNGSTISLTMAGTVTETYLYSADNNTWNSFDTTLTLNKGEGVYVKSANVRSSAQTNSKYVYFTMTGEFEAYHNINSMLAPSGFNTHDITAITSYGNYAFRGLFYNCSSLTRAPQLHNTTLIANCYRAMMQGSGITQCPELPATTLTDYCYMSMFKNCANLTTSCALNATNLASYCYSQMFQGCTGLTSAPTLPATTLANNCYYQMFQGCTGLTSAPTLPATTLASYCYRQMFQGCSNLNEVHISATDISASHCLTDWLSGVAQTGDFYCYDDSLYTVDSASGIPVGWTAHSQIINDNANKPLTFISEADGSTVSLKQASNDPNGYESSTDGTTWTAYTSETPITLNDGDSVAFRAAQTRSVAQTGSAYAQFSTTGTIKAYHNINSLLSPTFTSLSDLTSFGSFLFYYLFKDNANLYRAPLLPGTALGSYAYMRLFEGTSITAAPNLPATTIGTYAYCSTFHSCTSLTTPPVISAVDNLPANAFTSMFSGCTSLTQTPVLNAKTVPSEAYENMFNGCSSLNAVYVYAENISEISSLDHVPTQAWLSGVAATGTFHCYTSAVFRRGVNGIPTGWTIDSQTGNDDAALPLTFVSKANGSKVTFNPRNAVFQTSTDGGTTWTDHSSNASFSITINNGESVAFKTKANLTGNQSSSTYRQFTITGTVEAYHNVLSIIRASDWNDYNDTLPQYAFYKLFISCNGLIRSPMLLPTNLSTYCYEYMFQYCTGLTNAPSLPTTTLAQYCYYAMFNGCTGLTSAPSLPSTIIVSYCYSYMFSGCTGLTKAPELPAKTLKDHCYYYMFSGCSNLKEIRIKATYTSANLCLAYWLYNASATGDFYCVSSANYDTGVGGIPSGWTRHNI